MSSGTWLYYFNARWYDATLGRFVTEDPARDGLNWYIYTRNNPLRYIDPTGLLTDEHREELDALKELERDQRKVEIARLRMENEEMEDIIEMHGNLSDHDQTTDLLDSSMRKDREMERRSMVDEIEDQKRQLIRDLPIEDLESFDQRDKYLNLEAANLGIEGLTDPSATACAFLATVVGQALETDSTLTRADILNIAAEGNRAISQVNPAYRQVDDGFYVGDYNGLAKTALRYMGDGRSVVEGTSDNHDFAIVTNYLSRGGAHRTYAGADGATYDSWPNLRTTGETSRFFFSYEY